MDRMKLLVAVAAASAALIAPALAQAQAPSGYASPSRFAVGIGAGTLGGNVFGEFLATDRLVVRGQGSFLNFDHDFSTSSVKYNGTFKSNVGLGQVELHPATNPWFLSAGFVAGQRRVDVTANPSATASIKINGVTYTSSQIGSVAGTVDYGGASPVLGLGWDNSLHGAQRIGFRVYAGALIGDDPKVRLTAFGPFATDPTVQANLRAEEASLRNDANDFSVYPVVEAGVTYRF